MGVTCHTDVTVTWHMYVPWCYIWIGAIYGQNCPIGVLYMVRASPLVPYMVRAASLVPYMVRAAPLVPYMVVFLLLRSS